MTTFRGRVFLQRFFLWLWGAPGRVGSMRTWSVLKLVVFCLALAFLLPVSESYLAMWVYGPKFTQVVMALMVDKAQRFVGLLGSVPHQNFRSVLGGVPSDQLQLAGHWASMLWASMLLPMLLILCVVVAHQTWNSVSAGLDVLHPPKNT